MIATHANKLKDLFRVVSVKNRLRAFQPKIEFEIVTQDYVIRTARTMTELEKILSLRHLVFFQEWRGESALGNLDLDQFDLSSDHLMIVEKATQQVIGTYRIRSTEFNYRFYSETEFDLGDFLKRPGRKMELGRACTHPLHRNGAVIKALWRGVGEYMRLSGADMLFGCSSITGLSGIHLETLQEELARRGAVDPSLSVMPLPYMSQNQHKRVFADGDSAQAAQCDYPLLDFYLKSGARVSPLPAVDIDFDCIDFFTVLERELMSPLLRRRYGL